MQIMHVQKTAFEHNFRLLACPIISYPPPPKKKGKKLFPALSILYIFKYGGMVGIILDPVFSHGLVQLNHSVEKKNTDISVHLIPSTSTIQPHFILTYGTFLEAHL